MSGLTRYRSTVEYEAADGETVELSLEFDGGPTDYYWNHGAARDFYAERIRQEGGRVLRYGTGPALQNRLVVTYDVTGLTPDEIAGLAMEAVVQGESSEYHPDAGVASVECDRLPKEEEAR